MNVHNIVVEYLAKNHYDGLCTEDCGCGVKDLAPCGDGPFPECQPAYHRAIRPGESCDGLMVGDLAYFPDK